MGRAGSGGLPVRRQGEPLPDPHTPPQRGRPGTGARHASWFDPGVYSLLEQHGASLALGDDSRRPLPDAAPVGPIAYLRRHYGSRGRRGNYSPAELETWRRRIAAWRAHREVFVYLNNDWETFAPRNALTLRDGLPRAHPDGTKPATAPRTRGAVAGT